MTERVRVTTPRGLRLRNSARDGATIVVLREGEELEVVGRETWLHVRSRSGEGFVLSDYVEPAAGAPPTANAVAVQPPATGTDDIVVYEGPEFVGKSLRVHRDFVPAVREIETLARACGVRIYVTSGLRRPDAVVAGAIVKPAEFSNHHVGHALDMNLQLPSGELINSTRLAKPSTLPAPARQFIDSLCTHPYLRWGGKFSTPDPVHIDDGLNTDKTRKYEFAEKLEKLWG